jgi:predicted TIM-barrel fold metal-dependent hydrolase
VLNGKFVVDATVHPFDYSEENWGDGYKQVIGGFHHHRLYNKVVESSRPDYLLRQNEFVSDFDPYAMAHALFAESVVDFAIIHALPNLGFTKGVVTDLDKMVKLRERFSDRFKLYGWVTTLDLDEAIKHLEWQVREAHIDGLKCFPSLIYKGKHTGWRMDGPDFAVPLFEAARDLGIKNIAIHKALPMFGPSPMSFFKVDDLDAVLPKFPDINFFMIHAGMNFLEETCVMLHRFPNFHANLESTFANAVERPRIFAETLGQMLYHGTPEQIVFASGCNLLHPQPALEAFEAFQMPKDLVEGFGFPEVTDEIKAKILGLNIARTHGIDPHAVLAAVKDDEFERAKADGLAAPWSALRGDEADNRVAANAGAF